MKSLDKLLIVFLLVFISSCTTQTEVYPVLNIGDGGLLSKNPCSPPCFWNITPGITTEEEAINILETMGDVSNCYHWDKVKNGFEKGIGCKNIDIYFDDNSIVSTISFKPSQEITVSEIIQNYGEPEAVIALPQDMDVESPYNMTLLFLSKNMIIGLPEQGTKYFDLEQTTIIRGASYYFKSVFEENDIFNQPWKGYGKYY